VDRSTSMILVDPTDPVRGLTVYFPGDPVMDGKQLPLSSLGNLVDDIRATSISMDSAGTKGRRVDAPGGPTGRLTDYLGEGTDAVKIETSVSGEDQLQIATLVSRGAEVLVREEQVLDKADPAFFSVLEAQHFSAVSAYRPAMPPSRSRFRGEVSEPIILPTKSELRLEVAPSPQSRRLLSALLGVGAIGLAGVSLYLASQPVVHLPVPVPRSRAAATAEATPLEEVEPEEERVDEGEELPEGPDPEGEILFPARFRPSKASFWFRNRGEETRFVERVKALSEGATIVLVVPPDAVAQVGRARLNASRAKAVLNYLVEQGIPRKRMVLSAGKPGAPGQPNNRQKSVNLIIE
jgi:hypothetical protein